MSINLQKGQKIDLTKKDGSQLRSVMVGLGWDEAKNSKGGLFGMLKSSVQSIDCDASIILCGSDGKIISERAKEFLIYFANKRNANSSIIHQGDNLTGEGDGDDEQIMVNLQELPSNVEKLVFVVNIYNARKKNQHFGMIENAFIRVVDMDNNGEICHYKLGENYNDMTGLVVGEIYRKDGSWKFNAMGQPVKEASSLDGLVALYK